jgi:hypothetical protein
MRVADWKELCMDTTGGETLGRFWAAALGLDFRSDAEDGYVAGSTEGHGIAMCRVPEPKALKNRVHLDVHCSAVDELVGLGAAVVLPAEESGLPWTVMTDPEGNEFCAASSSWSWMPSTPSAAPAGGPTRSAPRWFPRTPPTGGG